MKTLREICTDLIFAAEVIDASEHPTTEDINRLHDTIQECREILKTRIKETKVYPFDELSDDSKERAISEFGYALLDYQWWESVFEDAKTVGIELTEFELDRGSYCRGGFVVDAENTVNLIIENHGEDCETAKTAREYVADLAKLWAKYPVEIDPEDGFDNNEYERDKEQEGLDEEFHKSILEDYRIILQKEYEYLASEDAIIETIEANEYEFTEDGKLA